MENLKVRRAGYCNRQLYEEFLPRYKMLSPETWPHWHQDPKGRNRGCSGGLWGAGMVVVC